MYLVSPQQRIHVVIRDFLEIVMSIETYAQLDRDF